MLILNVYHEATLRDETFTAPLTRVTAMVRFLDVQLELGPGVEYFLTRATLVLSLPGVPVF